MRDGKFEKNPFTRVKLTKVASGKTRFLTHEEERALIEKIGDPYGSWVRFAVLNGLRLGEQFGLKWADVDIERGILPSPQTKAGHVQYAHLNEEAKEILRGFDSSQRSTWVFQSENPATRLDQRKFSSRVFVPVVRALNLEGVTWHTLRHTFASRLAMSDQAEGMIAALLRHSTTGPVRRYAHLSPTHLKAAVEMVASFGKSAPIGSDTHQAKAEESLVSNGTVTKTVTSAGAEEGRFTEVIENIGAGDGI